MKTDAPTFDGTHEGHAFRRSSGHVLIIVENVPVSMDHRVSKQVESLVAHGYRVSVVTRRHPGNRSFAYRLPVRLLEYRSPPAVTGRLGYLLEYGYSLAMATILALRARATSRIDVVQICQPPDVYLAIGILMKALGCRVLVDQRDLLPELYTARYGVTGGAMVRMLQRTERLSQRTGNHVITVNDTLRDKAIGSSGVRPERVTVVRNGPVRGRANAAVPDSALKQGSPHLCCWVGVMSPQDRLDVLIRAIDHLVKIIGRTDCRFALIGDGDSRAESIALSRDLGLEPWVTFPGWMPEDAVFRYLATADIGVDSNLQSEVSPVKAMEYMACGLPVVAFDLAETRTTAVSAAAYATPGDPIALATLIDELLDDPARRRTMADAGRTRIREELAWERQAGAYLQVVDLLAGNGRIRTVA